MRRSRVRSIGELLLPHLSPSARQAALAATEEATRDMMGWLAGSREREAVCAAYRAAASDDDMSLSVAAQVWGAGVVCAVRAASVPNVLDKTLRIRATY